MFFVFSPPFFYVFFPPPDFYLYIFQNTIYLLRDADKFVVQRIINMSEQTKVQTLKILNAKTLVDLMEGAQVLLEIYFISPL